MRIDHVIYGTADLDAAEARVSAGLGLTAVGGGRHDGLGTHNRLVPLGDGSYLELLAVADPHEAAASELGAALQAAVAQGEGLLAWAVAVADVGPVAARLDTPIVTVGRQGRTGRVTAVLEALGEPCLPFFIERGGTGAAGATAATTWIEVAGDAGRLLEWLGGAELPVRVVDGEPAVCAVGIRGGRELRTR
jgi:catechol 2,3-dioxygenase-like lactoylglutathione lyase family enzyme